MLTRISFYTPFSYIRIHKNAIGKVETILDIGCGDGEFMRSLNPEKDWRITGMDIFDESLKKAKQTGVYSELIQGDLIEVCKKLVKEKRKFDVVFCSQVIEHITKKEGEELLDLADKLAKKRSIFTTPRGFMEQPEEFLSNNPHQHHKSGWEVEDFIKRGYEVRGIGFLPVWSEHGLGRHKNRLIAYSAMIISFIFSPLVYCFPVLGAGIFATKTYERK